MARAVLEIDGDTSGLVAAFGAAETAAKKAEAAAKRTGGVYRENARAMVAAERQMVAEAQRSVAAQARAEQQKIRAARMSADARKRAEQEATRVAQEEARKRGLSAEQEAKVKQNTLERYTRIYEQEERRQTRVAEQEARKRQAALQRVARDASRIASTERQSNTRAATAVIGGAAALGSGALTSARSVYGIVRDARQQRAARETALNSTLLQLVPSGASAREIASLRQQIMQGAIAERLDPDRVIEAVGQAQSFANALGGDTAEQRRANTAATLQDVSFAATIDPENMGGLVRLGALTRGRMNERDRSDLLRSFAGISFQGSVETDEAVRRGLPGLQEAWSTATAGVTDPAEASRRRLEVARDFAAQIQSQAASGRTVRVASNRTNTVRTMLSNEFRQDELGKALARRSMNEEQRAAFNAAFTRDERGRYRMNAGVRDTASNAARFFGTMFNNDAETMRNFLGAHGGGGARQLINRPEVDALVSYFAMATNARGEQVRQYDYVNELARSTITPEQERTMREVRGAEETRRLQDEENVRSEATNKNTASIDRLTNAISGFQARNPLAVAAAAPLALGAAKVLGAKGTAALATSAIMSENNVALLRGRDVSGRELSLSERAFRGVGMLAGATLAGPAGLVAASVLGGGSDIGRAAVKSGVGQEALAMLARAATDLSTTLRGGITATVSPTDATHAAQQQPVATPPAR